MKTKPLNIRVISFFILLAIINITLIFGWLNVKITPSLSKIDEFKISVSNELRKDYSNIDELINNLDEYSKEKDINYNLVDSKDKVIKDSEKGLSFFTSFIEVDNELYYIEFTSNNIKDINNLIKEASVFQIIVFLIIYLFVFIAARLTIIKPTEGIINDIKNYKFGKKIERKPIRGELGLIQNEFVSLTERLDLEKKEQHRIISSISHDIKTPLTSIIGYGDLIKEEDDLKVIKKHNNKITDKALNIKEILSTFDDYLVNYENAPLKLNKFVISDLVNKINNDYKLDLENNNIKFEVITKLKDEVIYIDGLKLKRIFSNLISNSIRYITSNGKITIEILKDDKDYIFKIKDNGKGVDKAILDKLFDPFYTTDKSRKISGLGLSICKEFVELHGGNIKAKNLKKGFEIEFTIPIK